MSVKQNQMIGLCNWLIQDLQAAKPFRVTLALALLYMYEYEYLKFMPIPNKSKWILI